jgi:hypothetical protein
MLRREVSASAVMAETSMPGESAAGSMLAIRSDGRLRKASEEYAAKYDDDRHVGAPAHPKEPTS